MKKAVIYSRVSGVSQEENTSLDLQVEKARLYAKMFDLKVVKEFQDVSSGKNTNRTGYQEMLVYISTHDIDSIIVYKLDRLHRNLKDLLNFHASLQEHQVSIMSVSEQLDTSTSTGKVIFQVVGSFAEFEGNRISERMAEGKGVKIAKGLFTAGKIPYGYNIEKSEVLYVVPEEAAKVKEIFTLRTQTSKSYRKIAKAVFQDEKKYGTVRYIIQNPAYIGKLRQENGRVVSIPRIVSPQLFNKANTK